MYMCAMDNFEKKIKGTWNRHVFIHWHMYRHTKFYILNRFYPVAAFTVLTFIHVTDHQNFHVHSSNYDFFSFPPRVKCHLNINQTSIKRIFIIDRWKLLEMLKPNLWLSIIHSLIQNLFSPETWTESIYADVAKIEFENLFTNLLKNCKPSPRSISYDKKKHWLIECSGCCTFSFGDLGKFHGFVSIMASKSKVEIAKLNTKEVITIVRKKYEKVIQRSP